MGKCLPSNFIEYAKRHVLLDTTTTPHMLQFLPLGVSLTSEWVLPFAIGMSCTQGYALHCQGQREKRKNQKVKRICFMESSV